LIELTKSRSLKNGTQKKAAAPRATVVIPSQNGLALKFMAVKLLMQVVLLFVNAVRVFTQVKTLEWVKTTRYMH